jgi:hypothetical protein
VKVIAVCDFRAEHEEELGFFEDDTFVVFARPAVRPTFRLRSFPPVLGEVLDNFIVATLLA